MQKFLCLCICLFGVSTNLFSQPVKSVRRTKSTTAAPLVIAQEFNTMWRTPRYISGQLNTGSAFANPWTYWRQNLAAVFNPEDVVQGTWRRSTLSKGYPMIGPFDVRNSDVQRWHIRLAKNSGLAGVLVDINCDGTGYFQSESYNSFGQLLDISQQEGFKIGIEDDASFDNNQARNLSIMTDRATKALLKYKDHPAYLHIDGQPVYQFNFYSKMGGWSYADLDTFFVRVQRAVGDVFWIIQDGGNDENAMAIPELDAIEDHFLAPNTTDVMYWAQDSSYAQSFIADLHQHQKKAAVNIFPGFDESKLGRSTQRYIHRDHGNTYSRQLDIASQSGADFVVVSSFNDWQENSEITPGWDFEDYSGDPYQYLKITASFTGTTFSPPPLPSKDSLDPLIWGKLFGIDKAGPVPSPILFDNDTTFSTTLTEDMSNIAGAEYFVDGWHNIRFSTTNIENGLHQPSVTDGVTSVVNRAGRIARMIDNVTGHYFYINDTGIPPGDYDAYVVVEYFDNGTNFFGIEYNSTTAAYDNSVAKYKENTGTWKTHIFHLDHATFAGQQNGGADFRVVQYTDTLIIARVGVILAGQGIPMLAQDGAFNSLSEKAYHSIAGINDGDVHGICVHGKDAAGNWTMSYASLLTSLPPMTAIPSVPMLASPANGSTNIAILPTFSWSTVAGATSYRLQVSTSLNFSPLQFDDSMITTTSYQVGPLLNSTTYYWRVNAKNYKGSSGWSAAGSLTTIIAAPQPPTLIAPADSATNLQAGTTLSWNAVSGATSYHLQLSTSSIFSTTIIDDSSLTVTSKATGEISLGTTYYWRVRAKNDGGYGNFSATRQFSTVAKTGIPLVIAQEFHLDYRTPTYISGEPVVGNAIAQPWCWWANADTVVDPEEIVSGTTWRRKTVSRGYPYLGPFDSRNIDVMRWHIRLAKNAGLSGLLVDLFHDSQTGYFGTEYLDMFSKLLDISQQENFKIGILDEASFDNDKAKDLTIMTDRAIQALKTFKDHPAYLKINGYPIYQFNFYGNFGGKWNYTDLETFFANVEAAVGKVYWMIQDGTDANLWPITQLNSIEDHPLTPATTDSVDWTQVTAATQRLVSTLHSHQKAAAINIFPGYDETKLGRGIYRVIHRAHGYTFSKQLDLASQAGADFVVISSLNDWQENSEITPGWDFEDYSGDPYQYLKIIAGFTGTVFSPPPLPSKDSLDPLIWGKLFGIDKAGPVPLPIAFDSDSVFSTTLMDDMNNVAAGEYFVDGWHRIRLKATNTENGLHFVNVSDGVTSVVNRSGRAARATDGTSGRYIYIADTSIASGDYDAYVAVEYFDNGFDSFGIQFSSTSAPYNSTTVIFKQNTNTWKTHVFHLDHAAFDGKENGGADFRIFQFSDSLIVARVALMLSGRGTTMSAQDGAFNSLIERVQHSISPINDGDLHGIYVHGKDAAGNWGISWASLLTGLPPVVTIPPAPTLTLPADSSKGLAINPTLNWNSAIEATSYRLQVSTSPVFSAVQYDDSTIITTSITVGPLLNDTTYYWRVNAKDYKGISGWSEVRRFTTTVATAVAGEMTKDIPTQFSLLQNYPNPFNPATRIQFGIPVSGLVTLKVFDILGREVAVLMNERKSPGTYDVEWNASSLSSGVYFYRLQAGSFTETKKLLLMK